MSTFSAIERCFTDEQASAWPQLLATYPPLKPALAFLNFITPIQSRSNFAEFFRDAWPDLPKRERNLRVKRVLEKELQPLGFVQRYNCTSVSTNLVGDEPLAVWTQSEKPEFVSLHDRIMERFYKDSGRWSTYGRKRFQQQSVVVYVSPFTDAISERVSKAKPGLRLDRNDKCSDEFGDIATQLSLAQVFLSWLPMNREAVSALGDVAWHQRNDDALFTRGDEKVLVALAAQLCPKVTACHERFLLEELQLLYNKFLRLETNTCEIW